MTDLGILCCLFAAFAASSAPLGWDVFISVRHMGVTLLNSAGSIRRHNPLHGWHSVADQVSVTAVQDYFAAEFFIS